MEASEHVDSHLRLTAEERALLAESPHTLDTPLSDDQLHFLEEHGYLVLRKLIEPRLCEAVVKQAFERADALMGLKRHVESTWHVLRSHGMTDLWHLPAQYELYQHPRLYSVFAQLHNTHRLCVSLDRISMKPPCRTRGLSNADLELHTDLNQWRSDVHRPFYQGGLCLEDCPAGGGGFFCLPGAHRAEVVERYKRAYESGAFANGRPQAPPAPEKLFLPYMDERHIVRERIEVPLERGDFVVWSSFLPHNGGYNTLTGQWRLQAFVRYMPLDGPRTAPDDALWHAKYQRTIALPALKTGERPRVYSTGGSANGGTFSAVHAEARLHRVPELTELGQRLFGLRNWL